MNESLVNKSSLSLNTKTRFINTIRSLSNNNSKKFSFNSFDLEQTQIEEECQDYEDDDIDRKKFVNLVNQIPKQDSSLFVSSSFSVSSLASTTSLKLDKFLAKFSHQVSQKILIEFQFFDFIQVVFC